MAVDAPNGADGHIAVARILRPRGRAGEVVAEVLTDFPERFTGLREVFIENSGGSPEAAELAEVWWHEGRLILRFAGVDSISKADELRGRLVLVPRQERLAPGERRYYLSEIVGCTVLDRRGLALGAVVDVEPTGGVDLLRVRRLNEAGGKDGGKEDLLIPFAEEICTEIDLRARRIVIEPPEGLLELND
jgi:16S rRNA processing protein RimM